MFHTSPRLRITRKSRLLALCAFLSLYIPATQAIITKIDILKGKNPKTGKEQYVYLLNDLHNSMGISSVAKIANNQRKALIKMFNTCDKNNTKVIIEDSTAIEIDYAAKMMDIKKEECIKSITYQNMQNNFDVLPCLFYQIAKYGLDTINVEFRLPNSSQNYPVFISNTIISTKIFDRINLYDDGLLLNKYYQTVVARVEKDRQILLDTNQVKKLLHKNMSHQMIIKEKILMFDAALLDVNVLHEIVNSSNKEKVFVILGGLHITNVSNILKQLGYKEIISIIGNENGYNDQRNKRKQLYEKIMTDMSFKEFLGFCKKYKENSDLLIYDGLLDSSYGLNDAIDPLFIESLINNKYQNQISYYSVTHPSNFKK